MGQEFSRKSQASTTSISATGDLPREKEKLTCQPRLGEVSTAAYEKTCEESNLNQPKPEIEERGRQSNRGAKSSHHTSRQGGLAGTPQLPVLLKNSFPFDIFKKSLMERHPNGTCPSQQ